MLGTVEAKFVTWAADKIFDLADLDKSRAESCRKRVSIYFEDIADCLSTISRELRENRIPREQGHYLEELSSGVEFVLASNFYGKPKLGKKDAGDWLYDLEQAASNAKIADMAIIKGKLELGPISVERHIEEIERTAGRFRGISPLLEATGPFSMTKKSYE